MGAGLSVRQRLALRHMGIDVWENRGPAAAPQADYPLPPMLSAEATPALQLSGAGARTGPGDELIELHKQILACTRCELHFGRTQAVCGAGTIAADLLIVGEAPGAKEDRAGEPFVGPAGQLLNAMLRAIGLDRDAVFIANVLKCRPPDDRNPAPVEIEQCLPYLYRQIELIRPKLILAVGRFAAHSLLDVGADTPLGKLRGSVHRYEPGDIQVVVTYHPAYLQHKAADKSKAWSDLLLALATLEQSG